MILVDTSVWIDHLRSGNQDLQSLLQNNEVLTHPFVIGELACGTLHNRAEILRLLRELPAARSAQHREVLGLVERERRWGRGVGWIDVHLLASALLSRAALWSLDRSLNKAAASLELAY